MAAPEERRGSRGDSSPRAAGNGRDHPETTAMRAACAPLGIWPAALLDADFIWGLSRLAFGCDKLGVSDVALALVAADANPGLSNVARALLAERELRAANPGAVGFVARPAYAAAATARPAGSPGTPIDLADLAGALEIDGIELERLVAGASGDPTTESNGSAWPSWQWPQPEPDRRIVAPAMTFSASRLNTFARCPRRFYYEYLCDAVNDTGSIQATYGRVFHEALEALHRDIRVPSQFAEHEILDQLSQLLDAAFLRARAGFASPLEYEVSRLKARSVAAHYARWLSREAQARPLEVRDVEVAQRLSYGGYVFVGFIDRIDRPVGGGPITIYDYKTGRVDDDPARYLERIRSGGEGQLALYWAMRRALGDDVKRIALISIRDPRDATWLLAIDIAEEGTQAVDVTSTEDGVVRIRCTPADLEQSIDALVARCEMISVHGIEHFEVGEDPPCSICVYAQACRERPAQEERIFAR